MKKSHRHAVAFVLFIIGFFHRTLDTELNLQISATSSLDAVRG